MNRDEWLEQLSEMSDTDVRSLARDVTNRLEESNEETMNVFTVIYNPNREDYELTVHRKGCREVLKEAKPQGVQVSTFYVGTPEEASYEWYFDLIAEGTMTRDQALKETKIKPCVEGSPCDCCGKLALPGKTGQVVKGWDFLCNRCLLSREQMEKDTKWEDKRP